MIPGHYSVLGPIGGSSNDESEALQADVMRFTAILGLCLMVIFALVQSLPVAGESRESSGEREQPIAAIESERDELEEHAVQLAALLQSTQSDVQALSLALEVERNLNEEQGELLSAQNVLESTLRETERELSSSLDKLERSEAKNQKAQEKISALEQEIAMQEAERLSEASVSEEITEELVAEEQLQEEDTKIEPEEPTSIVAAVEEEQGFSLRFSSNEALYSQVLANSVSVYARSNGQLWQLDRNGRAMRRIPNSGSLKINEMSARSIPSKLRGLLKGASGQSNDVIWGVVLSPAMLAQIERLMGAESGGVLSIQPDGQVILK